MNITREDMPGRQIALTIELDPETVNSALDRAYRQVVNQVDVPGFRRGRAPRYILERFVGAEMLTERAVKNILPQTLQDAIAEEKIEAMDVGEVEIVNMDPVQVKVVVVQPPLVELGDYGSIRVEKETTEITEEDVEKALSELRREGAPWNEPAEPRPIKEGDMVYLDLEGFTTEGELEEAKREEFPTIVGAERGGIPVVVNEALVGMQPGEEKDIASTLPDDYPVEALRDREVTYHVTTRSMKEQQLPELDDEFAKKWEQENIAALREEIERRLRERATESAETGQLDKVIDQLVEGSRIEVPDMMVNEQLDSMLKSLENRLKPLTLRQYFSYSGMNESEWRERNREAARERVMRSQALIEFARREGIAVEDEDVDTELDNIVGRFEEEEKEKAREVFSEHEMRHSIEDRVFQNKIMERLVGIAEGRIEAAPPPAEDATPASTTTEADGNGEAKAGTASDLEAAGGAAELLGTEGVDVRSENETGEASGGGTPSTAPALQSDQS